MKTGADPSRKIIRKQKKKFSPVDIILLCAAIIFVAGAVVIFSWRPVENYLREQKMSMLVEGIEKGNSTIIVGRNELAIPGEGYETIVQTVTATTATTDPTVQTAAETAMETIVLPEDVVLTALGTIKIEEIDLFLPLLEGATLVSLRYGAGLLDGTASPGEEGNAVVLGHRMKAYGSLFNRLGELSIDDTIIITMLDGAQYTYIIDKIIMKLDPAEIWDYVGIDSGSGKQLTLVTCTPTGVGSHRLIIIAHLQEEYGRMSS